MIIKIITNQYDNVFENIKQSWEFSKVSKKAQEYKAVKLLKIKQSLLLEILVYYYLLILELMYNVLLIHCTIWYHNICNKF